MLLPLQGQGIEVQVSHIRMHATSDIRQQDAGQLYPACVSKELGTQPCMCVAGRMHALGMQHSCQMVIISSRHAGMEQYSLR